MPDDFQAVLNRLLSQVEGIQGATFADLDGEDIAIAPREVREELRLGAAYAGIALRHLSQIEFQSGRLPISRISIKSSAGHLVAIRVAQDYQLVAVGQGHHTQERLGAATHAAALAVEQTL